MGCAPTPAVKVGRHRENLGVQTGIEFVVGRLIRLVYSGRSVCVRAPITPTVPVRFPLLTEVSVGVANRPDSGRRMDNGHAFRCVAESDE